MIKFNRDLLIILAILFIGVFLRLAGLTHQSMWMDEANGIRIAKKNPLGIISELQRDVSPPLHYFSLYIWMKIFGSGELSTRLFASVFGILFLPAIYYVGKSVFNTKVGIISTFITAIARFHIRYSQEVRMYSMLALFGLLSMYFLYKAIETNSKRDWRKYTIFTILTIYSHNYGLFIGASGFVFFIICLLDRKESILASWKYHPMRQAGKLRRLQAFALHAVKQDLILKKFLLSLLITGLAYLPWFPIFVIGQYNNPAIAGWIPRTRPYHIYETFKVHSGMDFWVFRSYINSPVVWLGVLVFLVCFLSGIFFPFTRKNRKLTWLLCYYFVTLAIPVLVSIKKPVYIPNRYSMAAWPAFPLILGLGISRIENTKKLSILLGVIFIFSSISLYHYYFQWIKSYDRDIAQYINSRGNKDDTVVFAPSFMDTAIDYYLEKSLRQIGYPWRSLYESGKSLGRRRYWRRPNEIVNLARSKGGRIFLVCNESVNWAGDIRAVRQAFDRNFGKGESKKFGDIEVILYR